jgi:hypothetical protein
MNSPAPLSLHGSCHCGRVSVELRTHSSALPAARACGCSFCTKHGAAWTSDPQGELVLSHRAPDDIRRYRFGLGITDFIICAHCGVPCAAVGLVDDRLLGVVNINTMDRLSDFAPANPASFDGEETDDRLARRRKGWTPARMVCAQDTDRG